MPYPLSYQQIAIIADCYTPLLALSCGFFLYRHHKKGSHAAIKKEVRLLLCYLLATYGLMLLDYYMLIWSAWGLDYSTHTALALCFICLLCEQGLRYAVIACLSLSCYAALMIIQHYHSLLDILSTSLVILQINAILRNRQQGTLT